MIRKFHGDSFTWDGIERHIYKENPNVFSDVTKQVLFEGEGDLPVQFRYFQVEKGGFSSLERHEHRHLVVVFKGKGHALLGRKVEDVEEGDLIVIPPWEWHQFRADKGERLGFFCLVNAERDIPTYPSESEKKELRRYEGIADFLDGRAENRSKKFP